MTSSLTLGPIFRRELNAPKPAGINPLDSYLAGLKGFGLSHPHDLELSRMAMMIEGMKREGLADRILVSGPQGRPNLLTEIVSISSLN